MSNHDDFNFEPVRGLPERLPEGEHILWQGRPSARMLARDALSTRAIAAYFVIVAGLRVALSATSYPLPQALGHAVPILMFGVIGIAILYGIAFVQARATVYTLTNKRVAMRIGAALTMTLNLPYTWIGTASLSVGKSGTGTIAFELIGDTRLSYVMTWPHVRPWFMARTQPALRCIPEAAAVARIFAEAAETRVSEPETIRIAVEPNTGGLAVAAE
jgi:Bacterial PH domain